MLRTLASVSNSQPTFHPSNVLLHRNCIKHYNGQSYDEGNLFVLREAKVVYEQLVILVEIEVLEFDELVVLNAFSLILKARLEPMEILS
jgi:hypothetical protein